MVWLKTCAEVAGQMVSAWLMKCPFETVSASDRARRFFKGKMQCLSFLDSDEYHRTEEFCCLFFCPNEGFLEPYFSFCTPKCLHPRVVREWGSCVVLAVSTRTYTVGNLRGAAGSILPRI